VQWNISNGCFFKILLQKDTKGQNYQNKSGNEPMLSFYISKKIPETQKSFRDLIIRVGWY
jgi:hypothetical protein